jgi:hypothetical protein
MKTLGWQPALPARFVFGSTFVVCSAGDALTQHERPESPSIFLNIGFSRAHT